MTPLSVETNISRWIDEKSQRTLIRNDFHCVLARWGCGSSTVTFLRFFPVENTNRLSFCGFSDRWHDDEIIETTYFQSTNCDAVRTTKRWCSGRKVSEGWVSSLHIVQKYSTQKSIQQVANRRREKVAKEFHLIFTCLLYYFLLLLSSPWHSQMCWICTILPSAWDNVDVVRLLAVDSQSECGRFNLLSTPR